MLSVCNPLKRSVGFGLRWALPGTALVLFASYVGLDPTPAYSSVQPPKPAPTHAVVPQVDNPAPLQYDLEITVSAQSGDNVAVLLRRAGAGPADADAANALFGANYAIVPGTVVRVYLGQKRRANERELRGLRLQPRFGTSVELVRDGRGRLRLARQITPANAAPQRYSGRVGDNLFWSLRAAGIPADAAADLLDELRTGNVTRPSANAQFDVIIDFRRSSDGKTIAGPILYAAIRHSSGAIDRLVRWTVGDETNLFNPSQKAQLLDSAQWPVSAPVTSGFGVRRHPILGFARMHRGIDFGASWGTPVRAVEDGTASAAGWAGGYGRQIRIAHPEGIETSYSHLSSLNVTLGDRVSKGQIIGHVGSSGLSTGPHLHFEVEKSGRAIDPRMLSFSSARTISSADIAAMWARVRQLEEI